MKLRDIYTKPGQQASTNTEITGTTSTPIFIASNSVHEYISQGAVTETIGVAGVADYHRLSAEAEAATELVDDEHWHEALQRVEQQREDGGLLAA